MQKCKLPCFFLTSTTALHHRDWLGLIAPESSISLRVFYTSSNMGGSILWNLSLYGSKSVKLITCSIVLVHPNSFSSSVNTLWYSISSSLAALAIPLGQAWSPVRSNTCINFFLLEADILGLLIPWISSNASMVPGLRCRIGISLAATTLANATPLFRTTALPVVFLWPLRHCCCCPSSQYTHSGPVVHTEWSPHLLTRL